MPDRDNEIAVTCLVFASIFLGLVIGFSLGKNYSHETHIEGK